MPPKPAGLPLTHFLAIPLTTPTSTPLLTASLARFAAEVTITDDSQTEAKGEHNTIDTASADPLEFLLPQSSKPGLPATAPNPADAKPDKSAGQDDLRVVPPKALRPATTLHLTLGMMSLRTPERVAEATNFLHDLDLTMLLSDIKGSSPSGLSPDKVEYQTTGDLDASRPDRALADVVKGREDGPPFATSNASIATESESSLAQNPLVLRLKGIHSMQSPRSSSALYANTEDSSGRLFPLCQKLRNKFEDAGLIVHEDRALKLHATIVNMTYAKERGRGGSKRGGPRKPSTRGMSDHSKGKNEGEGSELEHAESSTASKPGRGKIDARGLIERWKDEVWSEVTLGRISICEMGAKADSTGAVRYREIAIRALI